MINFVEKIKQSFSSRVQKDAVQGLLSYLQLDQAISDPETIMATRGARNMALMMPDAVATDILNKLSEKPIPRIVARRDSCGIILEPQDSSRGGEFVYEQLAALSAQSRSLGL